MIQTLEFLRDICWRALLLSIFAALFQSTDSQAAPILLVEFSHQSGGVQNGSSPAAVPFQFRGYEPNVFPTPVYFAWAAEYAMTDAGKSFSAPTELVQGATAALHSPTGIFDLQSGAVSFSQRRLNEVPWGVDVCEGANHTCVFVDDPTRHFVTAIERIIDDLVITPVTQNSYHVEGAQTVRLWGEPIPEPNTIAIIGTLHCVIVFRHLRRKSISRLTVVRRRSRE
jgi:hypothetical protein